MAKYKCHKEVSAFQIKRITKTALTDFKYYLEFEDRPAKYFPSYMFIKYTPECDDYYIVYRNGYESFSPKEVFEEGYTLIEE